MSIHLNSNSKQQSKQPHYESNYLKTMRARSASVSMGSALNHMRSPSPTFQTLNQIRSPSPTFQNRNTFSFPSTTSHTQTSDRSGVSRNVNNSPISHLSSYNNTATPHTGATNFPTLQGIAPASRQQYSSKNAGNMSFAQQQQQQQGTAPNSGNNLFSQQNVPQQNPDSYFQQQTSSHSLGTAQFPQQQNSSKSFGNAQFSQQQQSRPGSNMQPLEGSDMSHQILPQATGNLQFPPQQQSRSSLVGLPVKHLDGMQYQEGTDTPHQYTDKYPYQKMTPQSAGNLQFPQNQMLTSNAGSHAQFLERTDKPNQHLDLYAYEQMMANFLSNQRFSQQQLPNNSPLGSQQQLPNNSPLSSQQQLPNSPLAWNIGERMTSDERMKDFAAKMSLQHPDNIAHAQNLVSQSILQQQLQMAGLNRPNPNSEEVRNRKNEERTQPEENADTLNASMIESLALKMKSLLIPGEVSKEKNARRDSKPRPQEQTHNGESGGVHSNKPLQRMEPKPATRRRKVITKRSQSRSTRGRPISAKSRPVSAKSRPTSTKSRPISARNVTSRSSLNPSQTQFDNKKKEEDNLFWSEASVRVSTAIIKAGGTQKIASIGQLAVLNAARDAKDTSVESLNLVSAKLSSNLLSAGASNSIAAAGAIACLTRDFKEEDSEYINKKKLMKMYGDANEYVKKGVEEGSKMIGKGFEIAQNRIKDIDDTLGIYAKERGDTKWRQRRNMSSPPNHYLSASLSRSPPNRYIPINTNDPGSWEGYSSYSGDRKYISPNASPIRIPNRSPPRVLTRGYAQRDLYEENYLTRHRIAGYNGVITSSQSFDDRRRRYRSRSIDSDDSNTSSSTTTSHSSHSRGRRISGRHRSQSTETGTSLSRTKQSTSESIVNSSGSMSQSATSHSSRSRRNLKGNRKVGRSRRSVPSSSTSHNTESSQTSASSSSLLTDRRKKSQDS